MSNFCTIDTRADKELLADWEKHVIEGVHVFWVERSQGDVEKANQQWRRAISLKEEEGETQALVYCRDCLATELARLPRGSTNQRQSLCRDCLARNLEWPRGFDDEDARICQECDARGLAQWSHGSINQRKTFLVRCLFVQLVRLWAADILLKEEREQRSRKLRWKSDGYRELVLLSPFDREPVLACTLKAKLEECGDIEQLDIVTVVLCFCLQFLHWDWVKVLAVKHLPLLEERFGLTHHKTATFVQYLAESLLFNNKRSWDSKNDRIDTTSGEGLRIIKRHLRYLEDQTGKKQAPSLCFWYDTGRQLLEGSHDIEVNLARSLIEQAFKERVEVLEESHEESDVFFDELLHEFCVAQWGKQPAMYYDRRHYDAEDSHTIVFDLLRHCYDHQRFAEAEVLIRECLCHDGIFQAPNRQAGFVSLFRKTAQELIASQNVPRYCVYWEDPRTYLRRWARVTFKSASPPEFFPGFPVQLTVRPDRIDIAMSTACREDLVSLLGRTSEENMLEKIRNLTTLTCLDLMRAKGIMWYILWKEKYGVVSAEKRGAAIKQPSPDLWPSTIWLFPELHFTHKSLERAASAMVSLGDNKVYLPKYCVNLCLHPVAHSQFILETPPYIEVPHPKNDPLNGRHYSPRALYAGDSYAPTLERGARRNALRQALGYSVTDMDVGQIHVTASYVSYGHFQTSRAFRYGFTYVEYLDVLKDLTLSTNVFGLREIKERLCKWAGPSSSQVYWQLSCKSIASTTLDMGDQIQHALFNAIPCDAVGFDTDHVLGGLNVVSSRWADWISFSLSHTVHPFNPKLVLPNGDLVPCRGYIMGTLWNSGLEKKWTGIRVFVVDAELRIEGSDKTYNFIFNPNSFTDSNSRPVPNFEKRKICGNLCPSFFVPGFVPHVEYGASFWDKKKKARRPDTAVEMMYWDEMNRREAWDRDFEKRIAKVKKAREHAHETTEKLGTEKSEEDDRRRNWDLQHANTSETRSWNTAST